MASGQGSGGMKDYAKALVEDLSGLATEHLVQKRQPDFRDVRVVFELFDLAKFNQVAAPKGIPLFQLFRRRYVQLPMNSNAFATAERAKESLDVLIFPLKLTAVEAGESSITHDA